MSFSCGVEGKYAFASKEQICASFKASIDRKLGVAHGSNVGVKVSVLQHGGLSAVARYRDGGGVRSLPDIGIDVMDRPLSMHDVDRLADLVSNQIAEAVDRKL